jgi:hypothetical protein
MVDINSSLYHRFLRVAALVLALVLVFDSGLILPVTERLSTNAGLHLASVVGVSVGVSPTEVNQLTAKITELETELEAKERLIAVNIERNNGTPFDFSTFVLSTILFVLLLLIVLNYFLDYKNARRLQLT